MGDPGGEVDTEDTHKKKKIPPALSVKYHEGNVNSPLRIYVIRILLDSSTRKCSKSGYATATVELRLLFKARKWQHGS